MFTCECLPVSVYLFSCMCCYCRVPPGVQQLQPAAVGPALLRGARPRVRVLPLRVEPRLRAQLPAPALHRQAGPPGDQQRLLPHAAPGRQGEDNSGGTNSVSIACNFSLMLS